MNFSKLVGKTEKIVGIHKRGRAAHCAELQELESMLGEKILRYQAELENTEDPRRRKKLEVRLKVINAQLNKSKKLSQGEADVSFTTAVIRRFQRPHLSNGKPVPGE